MYNNYLEWNSPEFSSSSLGFYDDLSDLNIDSWNGISSSGDFETLLNRAEEDMWVGENFDGDVKNSSQRLFEGLVYSQFNSFHDHLSLSNHLNLSRNKNCASTNFECQTKCIPIKNHYSLIVDNSSNMNLVDIRTYSDNSEVSHSSTLNGVWVVPNVNPEINLDTKCKASEIEACSKEFSSTAKAGTIGNSKKNVFTEQKQYDLINRARMKVNEKFKVNASYKYKQKNEFLMLLASGGAPLGKLEEIPGVEWYPERQSWRVFGRTGVSWCVRRKTWRVWFATSSGTRATRSFNPKEHGSVAAALKSAIEFLEQKRAEKLQIQKNSKTKIKRT